MNRFAYIIFSLVVLLHSGKGQLANSPWPMFQHDLQHTGRSLYKGPNIAILRWEFQVEGLPGSPVIGTDGTVYLPTGMLNTDTTGFLYAINPNGTQKWRYQFAGIPSSTTPAIASDGTIYVHMNGDEGNIAAQEKLYAINSDGTLKWIFLFNFGNIMFTSYIQSSPAIGSDGTIYVGSIDGRLYAINPNSTLKWLKDVEGSCSSSPAIGTDGTIYVSSDAFEVYAFNPDGTQKWSTHFFSNWGAGQNSPSIGADGTIYLAYFWVPSLYAINPDSTMKWTHTLGYGPQSAPAIASDTIIYVSDNGLYALNPDSTLKWKFNNTLSTRSSPLVDSGGTVYWNEGGVFWAVNSNGTEKWHIFVPQTLTKALDPTPAIGSDGTIYFPWAFEGSSYLKAYCDNSLPVELSSLTARAECFSAVLIWKTATEINNYGFEVERRLIIQQQSIHSHEWARVGFVSGSGTSNSPKEYCFIDKNLPEGRYAYRLKQIDQNGSFKYSGSVEVEVRVLPTAFSLEQNFPNPFNPTTHISFAIPSISFVTLKIFDLVGREVATLISEELTPGNYSREWNATNFPSGVYFYHFQAGAFIKTKQLVLLK